MDARGKVLFAYRADTWPEDTRPAGYEPARHPTFLGAWMWRGASGGAQPEVTLFGEVYRPDNPTPPPLAGANPQMPANFRPAPHTDAGRGMENVGHTVSMRG